MVPRNVRLFSHAEFYDHGRKHSGASTSVGTLFLICYFLSPHESYLIQLTDRQSDIPHLLHTCRESREEGLRHYTLCVNNFDASLYINSEADVLVFTDYRMCQYNGAPPVLHFNLSPDIINKIGTIMIFEKYPESMLFQLPQLKRLFRQDPVLHLTLVVYTTMGDEDIKNGMVTDRNEETVEGSLHGAADEASLLEKVYAMKFKWGIENLRTSVKWGIR